MDFERIAEDAVKYGEKIGVSEVAAAVTHEKRKMLRFSNNSITIVQSWNRIVPTVYMTLGRNRAAAYVEDPSADAMRDVMKTLKSSMDIAKPSDVQAALPKGPFSYEPVPQTYDARIPEMTDELADMVEETINSTLAEGAQRSSGVLQTSEWQRFVKTSAGVEGRDRGTNIELTVRAFVADDASGQGISCATRLDDFNPKSAGMEAARIACQARNPVLGTGGKYTVLFGPTIMANLLERVADAATAYSVDLGFSFLTGRLDQKVASEKLTLVDDPRMVGGINSCSLDEEGYPTRRKTVIERGVLKTYLHSSYSAAKYGGQLTGNAFFVGGTWGIAPIPLNTVIEAGEYDEDELFDQVGDGLYLTNNWYTRFQNYQTGDFSSICRDGAFEIRNGKIERPLKGLRISDSIPRILQAVTSLSKQRKWIRWWEVTTPVYLPSMIVQDVGITRATK